MVKGDILLVIDDEILPDFHVVEEPFIAITAWLDFNDAAAGVASCIWAKFKKEKNKELRNLSDENKSIYFGIIKGLIIDCSDESEDPIQATKNIVDRNYATIRFLIVKDPAKYKCQGLKIADDSIFSPAEFYVYLEINNPDVLKYFKEGT